MTPHGRPQVRVDKHVRAMLGNGLPREGMIKALLGLQESLPAVTAEARADRIKSKPSCFQFNYNFIADGKAWGIACVVDDSAWPTRLRVVEVIVCGGNPIR